MLLCALFALLFLLPTVLTITNSFMTQSEITANYGQVFDNASNSRALLRLSASLIGAGESAGNQLLGQKVFTVEVPAAAADAAGGAQAMARAVDEAAAQLSRWLQGYGR